MDEIKLSHPLAVDPDVMPTSCYGQLALALGKMSGGMLADGTIVDASNDALSLMSMQAILMEAGVDLIIMGMAPAVDGASTFTAMSDGSIWRIKSTVSQGELVTYGYKSSPDEIVKDCSGLDEIGDLIKSMVADALFKNGRVEQKDVVTGHVYTDAHAAICLRVSGKGKLIVNVGESGAVRGGFDFILDCPKPNADMDYIAQCIRVREMTMDEIKAEQESVKKAHGIETPFPVKVGEA